MSLNIWIYFKKHNCRFLFYEKLKNLESHIFVIFHVN